MKSKYYRQLEEGEIKQKGDLQPHGYERRLEPIYYPDSPAKGASPVLRPVQVDEWIEYDKQKPTKADGAGDWAHIGSRGQVQCIYADNSCCHMHWNSVYMPRPMWWRRITPPPEPIVKRVRIKEGSGLEHDLVPNPDGSVKVGCVKITSEQMDEIIRQRKDAMGEDCKCINTRDA